MGVKDSKPSFISYEDAAKRVSDSELRRIREAFKRCAGANGSTLSLEAFIHEVLCDGVPTEVAEWLYQACGGTKRGITFKDLLCGVVVLTKGNIEEKIKFLWTLYVNNQSENGTYIYKRDFAKALQLENTSLPVSESYRTIEILTSLFGNGEKVTFDQFRSWLLIHKDATVLSKWLLFDRISNIQDLETPTFYQSLAGVTHLEERDIIELEKFFWSLRNTAVNGELDATSMRSLLSPPMPRAAVEGTFLAFDENRDGHIDFKELCCGLSAACRGPTTERLKFCFKIFDLDRDGILDKKELVDMVGILCTVANEAIKNQGSRSSSPDGDSNGSKEFDPEVILTNLRDKLVAVQVNGRKPVFHLGPNNSLDMVILSEEKEKTEESAGPELALRLEEFLIWAVESAEGLVAPFLELVFDVCHVVLGLRPQCKHRERDIVLGWIRRETCRGLSVGQFWYLVAAEWWSAWLLHASAPPHACCRPRQHDDAPVCDDSFTTNSTESMGSLLWRAESASLGSAGGSSGLGSTRRAAAPHPGPVHNARLLAAPAPAPAHAPAPRALTGEGGHLRRDVTLAQHRDFELLPDALWRALALWYGAPDPLPRQVIRPPGADVELELYPLQLKILRHVPSTQRITTTFSALGAGAAAVGAGAGGGALYAPAPPERQLAYTAAFSRLATVKQVTEFLCNALGLAREDVRLWALSGDEGGGGGGNALLLDDERPTLAELHMDDRTRLLLEVRNPDLTWPEEIGALGGALGGAAGGAAGAARWAERRDTLTAPQLPGATGLHNLGNTCYMNAALQSVWNTGPLAQYFNSGMHLYEVNTSNPLGTKGALAMRFGELCKEVWTSGARSVAPLRVRWCVTRHARALAGGGQHDAQELLAWLLDALHEDLNRAARPAPPPAPAAVPAPSAPEGAAPRPDRELAGEAWAAHAARNDSIMTELFYGQLKSKVRCSACARESVRFDTFNMLSLPLPMESYVRFAVTVVLQDGAVPVRYGVRVNSEGTYLDLKKNLSELCGLEPDAMALVVVADSMIARWLCDDDKVGAAADLTAYELPRERARARSGDSGDTEDSGDTADTGDAGDSDDREATADLEETDSGVTEGSADDDADADAELGGVGGARGEGGEGGAGAARGSVSVARSSLCMPALFCFKPRLLVPVHAARGGGGGRRALVRAVRVARAVPRLRAGARRRAAAGRRARAAGPARRAAGRGLGAARAAPALPVGARARRHGARLAARQRGRGAAPRGPGQLPARLHAGGAPGAALPLRRVPGRAARHQEAADLAPAARADNPPEAIPVREQQVDKVPQGGQLPLRGLRPDALSCVRSARNYPPPQRTEIDAEKIRHDRGRGRDHIGERLRRRGRHLRGRRVRGSRRAEAEQGAGADAGAAAAAVHEPHAHARHRRQPGGLPPAPPAARRGPLRPEVQPVRGRVAHGAAERRALRGVHAPPVGRVAVLQRQLVPRAAAARAARPGRRRRLPAVLRAPRPARARLPAAPARPRARRPRRAARPRRRRRPAQGVRARLDHACDFILCCVKIELVQISVRM